MKKSTLNELMGKRGQSTESRKLTLDDLGDLLGERMPKLSFTPVGRYRLTTALRNRFGESYRNLPGIDDILGEFDKESAHNLKVTEMKMIKPRKG
jgi:hypothetical protein